MKKMFKLFRNFSPEAGLRLDDEKWRKPEMVKKGLSWSYVWIAY